MNKKQILLTSITEKINAGIQEIGVIYDSVSWGDRWLYANWLAQTFYYTRHATRIISWAAAKTPHSQEWIHLKLIQHIQEEKNHEELAHHDLKNLGFSMEQFPEQASTTAYYSTLFYLLEHVSPMSLFGYFSILEGLAINAGVKLHNYVENQYGKNTATFLKVHCKADVQHFEEDLSILEKFDENELISINKSVELSIDLYKNLMMELIENSKLNKVLPIQTQFSPISMNQ